MNLHKFIKHSENIPARTIEPIIQKSSEIRLILEQKLITNLYGR